jgi:MFS family permease
LAGAIAAFFAVKLTDWRVAYFIGGGMGVILLILRVNVLESIVFNKSLEKRGHKSVPWWTIFTSWSRFVRYIRCMGIGLPTYMVIGIYSTFGNEFAKALGIAGDVQASSCVLYTYIGVVTGDFFSGILSQWLRSRRKAILLMISMTLGRSCVAFIRWDKFRYDTLHLLCLARLLDRLHCHVPNYYG